MSAAITFSQRTTGLLSGIAFVFPPLWSQDSHHNLQNTCDTRQPIIPLGQTHTMACANVDMDIHGVGQAPRRAAPREPPMIWHYQASELMPDHKGPLHDLLQKQPAVLGVSDTTARDAVCQQEAQRVS